MSELLAPNVSDDDEVFEDKSRFQSHALSRSQSQASESTTTRKSLSTVHQVSLNNIKTKKKQNKHRLQDT